jgi:hypothetical protein
MSPIQPAHTAILKDRGTLEVNMKQSTLCHSGFLVGQLAAMLLVFVAVGPVAATTPIAEVENLGNSLVFHPIVEFAKLVLTVTGPCEFEYRQVVLEGEPSFRLDATTIDGVYTYNLMREEAIDPAIIAVLQQARANFDPETPKQLCRDGKLPAPPISQAEGFRVLGGEILFNPNSTEQLTSQEAATASSRPTTPKDFVINDDLIVDGSACIGFDCVNGESFGFDTLRLKENNLRIKFDDTSTASSFPRNDWQLTANDSANGGASRFSIDDVSGSRTPFTVEANARSHSLYVDDGGRIGSRTATPSVELHTIDGDTPSLRLQQDGSSGFAPQTWDVAGNETNFFIRDVTGGSALPFRIRPGAPTSAIFIDANGDIGIGTSSPEAKLEVHDGAVIVNGGFQAGSARAIKKQFEPVDRPALLESLAVMPIESWAYRQSDDQSRHLGPMAEDFFAAFGLGSSDQRIDLVDSTGVSLAALQGVLEMLAERDRELARLKARLATVERALGQTAPAGAAGAHWQ